MKKIAILCEMFFYYDGELCQFGGGERYLYDLAELLKTLKYQVEVYQFSYKPFTKSYKDLTVKGLGNIRSDIPYTHCLQTGLEEFYRITEKYDGYIYLTMNLAQKKINKPVISISHGIWWDTDKLNYKQPDWQEMFKGWLRNVEHIVSVDTNSVKQAQTYCPKYAEKMTYIPNYVNLDIFKPNNKEYNEKFTVLFPRRLHYARGYSIAMEAADYLTKKYNDIEFLFVGKGLQAEEKMMSDWVKNRANIKWEWHEMFDMDKVYNRADITIIPTLWAEGTSLSCIESQACGVPTIVTCVGGLTDLVFNNYNGLIIKPDAQSLIKSIEYAYLNRDEVSRWGKNAISVSDTFNKNRWNQQWANILSEIFN